MRNSFISALAAIALALPLGIAGLTITAPATATNANGASDEVDELLEPYGGVPRCSAAALWHCDHSVVELVAGDYRPLFDDASSIPDHSTGANQITFDTLADEIYVDRTAFGLRRVLIVNYLRTVFPDPYESYEHRGRFPYQATGFISPDAREAIEAAIAADRVGQQIADEEERRRRELEEAELLRQEAERERVRLRRKLDAFRRECRLEGHRQVRSDFLTAAQYDSQGRTGTNRCVLIVAVPVGGNNNSLNAVGPITVIDQTTGKIGDKTVAIRLLEETYHFKPERDDLGLYFLLGATVAFQVTPVEPLGSLAEIAEIEDHREVTSVNRGEIVELQEEVTEQEERLLELEPAVARNVQIIDALGNSVGVLSAAVTGLSEDAEKNTAGIALAYALDAPGLSQGKRFAITGALGQFRGESAVGFSGSFKAGENVLISVGGGFAGSGDSSVTGGRASATYEW